MSIRGQQHRLSFPLTSEQVSGIDDMFDTLFKSLNNGNLTIDSSQVATGVLGPTHGGTGLSTYLTGDLIYASATDVLSRLAIGTVGKVLRSTGVIPAWSTFTIPNTFVQGDLIYASATNVLSAAGLRTDSAGQVLTMTDVAVPATPAAGKMTLYAVTNNGHTTPNYVDQDGTTVRLARDRVILVRNTSGSDMTKGQLVDVNGSTGNIPTVRLADADQLGPPPFHAEGMLLENIANNAFGQVMVAGLITGIDTSGFIEGAQLYLSETAGAVTSTAPSSPSFTQEIGTVTRQHATQGEILLNIPPRVSFGDPLAVAHGGTGLASYAIGDLLYASAATTLSRLADVAVGAYLRSGGVTTAPLWSTTTLPNAAAVGDVLFASATNVYSNLADVVTGNALISGGVTTAPSWGKIGLTTHISGVLAEGNGGTNQSTYAQGDLLYASAANTLSKLAKNTTATRYLSNTGTTNNPAWAQINIPDGLTIASQATGDILYASSATVWARLAIGSATTVLHGGTTPAYSAVSLTADVSGILPVANGGSGTSTAFTAGSVVFAGASGVYSQDNANLFWDDTNNYLGIGTSNPSAALHVLVAASSTIANFASGLGGASILFTPTTNHQYRVGAGVAVANDWGVVDVTASSAVRLLIDGSGNIGIGTASPGALLHVSGGSVMVDNVQSHMCKDSGGTGRGVLSISATDICNVGNVAVATKFFGTSFYFATHVVRMDAYGAGTATFDASGNITSVSDERLKREIRPWTRGLAFIAGLETIDYFYGQTSGLEQRHRYVGFGAGQVQTLAPELVFENARGHLSLWERGITAGLVNAVKELKARVETLEAA